jgi:hypothetical protein
MKQTSTALALLLAVCTSGVATGNGWKFLVEAPDGKWEKCPKPPCYKGLFMGGTTVTREQCEAARPYFNKDGFKVGPCVPFDQRQPGEVSEIGPIASLLRNTPEIALHDLVNSDLQSMIFDAVFVKILNIRTVPTPAPPPPKYDHVYRGQIELVEDMTAPNNTRLQADELMGWADPLSQKGKCTIHVPPMWHLYVPRDWTEIFVMDPIAREHLVARFNQFERI